MATWFSFRGVASFEKGVCVMAYPNETIAQERIEFQPIIGRSGTLALRERADAMVFDDIVLDIQCYLRDYHAYARDEVARWLRGYGVLILGNNPDYCFRAHAINQIDMEKVMRGHRPKTFKAVFRCAPFRYLARAESCTCTAPGSITNRGSIEAEPIIRITGTGNVTLSIGDVGITLTGMSGTVIVDCETGTALAADTGANTQITLPDGVWPAIPTGKSDINWTGAVSEVIIEPNWRWL